MPSRRSVPGALSLPAAAAALGVPLRPSLLNASALDVAEVPSRHPDAMAKVARSGLPASGIATTKGEEP